MIKRIFIALTLITSLFLVGCGAASYSISGGPDKVTIKVNAENDKYGESFVMDISKNETIHIDSQLEKGSLKIEFFEVINTADADETDEYEIIDTIKTISVYPGDQIDLSLEYSGDFMPALTAVGQTVGTVILTINK